MRTGVNSIKQRHYQGFTILRRGSGFTIVELLVVIVVIGILAAITIVSYTGISQKATVATLTSDLDSASRQIKLYQVTSTTGYPTSFDINNCPIPADDARCLKPSPGTSYLAYMVINNASPQSFCITATKSSTTYRITNDSAPTPGDCSDFGLVLRLDAGNTASYPSPFNGTTWVDLSGNSNNGTLMNSVAYDSGNSGSLVFDGINDYVNAGNDTSLDAITSGITVETWIKPSALPGNYQRIVAKQYANSVTTGDSCYQLGINNSNQWRWAVGGAFDVSISSPVPVADTWYHFVGTYNRAVMKMYINGVEVYTNSYSNPIRVNHSQILTIGTTDFNNSQLYYYKGLLSSVSIYKRALSGAEVLQEFNNLHDRYGI